MQFLHIALQKDPGTAVRVCVQAHHNSSRYLTTIYNDMFAICAVFHVSHNCFEYEVVERVLTMSETSMFSCQSDAMRLSAVACMIISPTEQIDTAQCSCREYMQVLHSSYSTATARGVKLAVIASCDRSSMA
jgi:hypothetical protein